MAFDSSLGKSATAMPKMIALPSLPSMVPPARIAVRNLLAGCPRADDAELVASELATNAILHSTSDRGTFQLTLDLRPGRVRIEVSDAGPAPPPAAHTLALPSAHELAHVPALASAPAAGPNPAHDHDPHTPDLSAYIDPESIVEEYGRGLTVIGALSDRWGHDRYHDHSVWWAELTWLA
jgi:hypothetical protein